MSDTSFRSKTAAATAIDRSKPVHFRFDGKDYFGFEGDTLASALIANGVHMVARSFKYHRPRGILGAGSEDPAGLVQVGQGAEMLPNMRATEVMLYDGLEAFAQNCWPSLGFDVGSVSDCFWQFLPAGFYYKTFMGPPGNWMNFEPIIRQGAGLGKSPQSNDPDRYEHVNRHCEVLVVGGGPAGIMAARAAASGGARVILVEETAWLGGHALGLDPEQHQIGGMAPADWIAKQEQHLYEDPDVTVLKNSCAFGYYTDNWVTVAQTVQAGPTKDDITPRERLWRIRAEQVILATGAVERPLVFHGNDRPGIMLSSAARLYLHRHGVLAGRRPLLFTNNSEAYQAVFDMTRQGANVAGIVDIRDEIDPALTAEAAHLAIPLFPRSVVVGTKGRHHIRKAFVMARDGEDGVKGPRVPIDCDLLISSGGWSPNVALFSQSRGKLQFDDDVAGFKPYQSWQKEASVAGANGCFDLAAGLSEAIKAGKEAAKKSGFEGARLKRPKLTDRPAYSIEACWHLPNDLAGHKQRAFVDLQDDVTTKDLKLAVQEGYRSVEHAKRYTTLGMGTDQGKTSNLNGFGVLAENLNVTIPEVGTTTFRAPYKPVYVGTVAGQHVGQHFLPRRTTPMHSWHEEQGAIFETVGDWLRARVYPRSGETFDQALQRECLAARKSVGVMDASTLGKIDIKGPDAREFLNRIYSNAWLKLAPGRCRYGLMLNEDGMVFDDGVTACIADDHFHMTTTTGGAAHVLEWLEEFHQTEWPELKVYMTSVTEQWAVVSICGPESPKLISELLPDMETDPEKFKFLDHKTGTIDGIPIRVFRISFTGETSYEINIPARYGLWLWKQVMEKGAAYDITPYGTEGMHLLRAEKGFIIVGQDTDGTVTPNDLDMAWAVKKSADFVGRRSLYRSDTVRTDRRQLVGLLTKNGTTVLEEGSQIIANETPVIGNTKMIGWVTSSYFSPTLGRSIAMALIEGGLGKVGETVYVVRPGETATDAAEISGKDFLSEEEGAA